MSQIVINSLNPLPIPAASLNPDLVKSPFDDPTVTTILDDSHSATPSNMTSEYSGIPASFSPISNEFPKTLCDDPQSTNNDGHRGGDTFDAARLFAAVFSPAPGEALTMMYDLPHGEIADSPAWAERRAMVHEWWERIKSQAAIWNVQVNPIATYLATGYNNGDLPETCLVDGEVRSLGELIMGSTMIMAMTQFSATAPLDEWIKINNLLRVASMPGVLKAMEATALSVDYEEVKRKSVKVGQIFERAIKAEVLFSTGHRCNFALGNITCYDDGILHSSNQSGTRSCNLPTGEVYMVPKNADGDLPHIIEGGLVVYSVRNKQIVDISGDEPIATKRRAYFDLDPARRNIAEFAVGINNRASGASPVTVEAEKAHGIHWAYGRDKHLPGGKVGAEHFLSPEHVVHQDIVYAKGRPITCSKLTMKLKDGSHKVIIEDGELLI